MNNTHEKTKTVVGVGVLTAVVLVLQAVSSIIKPNIFGVSITLTLVPIIVGAALYGYKAGAWLGLVFSVFVLFQPDTLFFHGISVPGTVVTVILKGTLAGLCAGLAYHALEKRNTLAAVVLAGIVAPVINTGVFLMGCFLFFFDAIKEMAVENNYSNAVQYMFFGIAGINFCVELALNLILSTAIVKIIHLGRMSGAGVEKVEKIEKPVEETEE